MLCPSNTYDFPTILFFWETTKHLDSTFTLGVVPVDPIRDEE